MIIVPAIQVIYIQLDKKKTFVIYRESKERIFTFRGFSRQEFALPLNASLLY